MKLSIQLKIVSVIVLVLLAGTATSVYVTVTNQRANLLEATERTLSVNTELLNLTIRNIMLSGEAPIAVRTMASLQTVEQFEEIAIYRTDGSVAFNNYTTVDFVNSYQNRVRFERTPRVDPVVLENPDFRAVLATNTPVRAESSQAQELEYYFPILNYKECRGCHGDTPFIRGVAHFRISVAGVYEQIATARNTLGAIFLAIGVVLAGLLIFSVHRVVVAPVLSIGRTARVVGAGNLDTRIDLRSRDELGDLARELNEMIAGLGERNQLLVTNSVVEARNAENRKYLDTIQEGLLLLDPDYRISEQYSRYLVSLFGTDEIAGRSFVDFVFPDTVAQAAERKDLSQFLEIIFNNTVSDVEMIMQINPLRDRVLEVGNPRRRITVDVTFHRILRGDVVENVMMIFQDRTEIVRVQRELADERQRAESEIEQVAALLRAGPQAFTDFVAQGQDALDDLELHLGELGSKTVLDTLFRKMHSLKGAARYLGFRRLESAAHEVEDLISVSRGPAAGPRARGVANELGARIRGVIATMQGELDAIRRINERFRSFTDASAQPTRAPEEMVASLERMTVDIARELGRKVRVVSEGSLGDPSLLAGLRDTLIHLLRNAVDHGIEEPLERVAAGKAEEGTVRLTFSIDDSGSVIQVADDGRGIDFEAVRRTGVSRRLIGSRPEDQARAALLRLLFMPGFSSRADASGISGRGVGLDVVHDAVKRLGGQIAVLSEDGKGTRFTLRIPSRS